MRGLVSSLIGSTEAYLILVGQAATRADNIQPLNPAFVRPSSCHVKSFAIHQWPLAILSN
jgi:hypothetical protein